MRDSITARRCDRRSPQSKERHDSQQTHHLPGQRSGDTAHRSGPRGLRRRRRRHRGAPPAASKTTTAPTQTATVRVANSRLGRILVDSAGHRCTCSRPTRAPAARARAPCAAAWPPLRTGATPDVAGGANAALVGTIPRSDGARQVTYNGHPLYTFVKDHKPGDVNGQGLTAFGAAWFAVSPAGNQISSQTAGHGSGSSPRPAAAAPPAASPTGPKAPRPVRSRLRQPTTASPKTTVVTVTRITTAGRVTATGTSER